MQAFYYAEKNKEICEFIMDKMEIEKFMILQPQLDTEKFTSSDDRIIIVHLKNPESFAELFHKINDSLFPIDNDEILSFEKRGCFKDFNIKQKVLSFFGCIDIIGKTDLLMEYSGEIEVSSISITENILSTSIHELFNRNVSDVRFKTVIESKHFKFSNYS